MNILFAVLAALGWGSSDFFGSWSSQHENVFVTTGLYQLAGLVPVGIAALFLQGTPTWHSYAIAAAEGACESISLVLLFVLLAWRGGSVYAPVVGVTGLLVAIGYGIPHYGCPTWPVLVGIPFAGLAIWLLAVGAPKDVASTSVHKLPLALGIGCLTGLCDILLANIPYSQGMAPLAVSRVAGCLVLVPAIIITHARGTRMSPRLAVAVGSGACGAAGTLMFFLAVQSGEFNIVTPISSLSPMVPVGLAIVASRQRVGRVQTAGLVAGLVALPLLSLTGGA